jgi:predicted Zn-dependent peptidase
MRTQKQMNDIKIFKLKNGITVINQRAKTTLAHMRIYFKVGSIVETAGQKGIAHLTEHLMFKGTQTRTAAEVVKLLEIKGAKVNAFTDYENTCYFASIKLEFLKTIFDLFSDMIKNKRITRDEFETEKSVVIQELKSYQDEHDACNQDNLCKQVYGVDPIVGFENTLRKITLKDVYAFMKKYYVASNMTISLLSDKPHKDIKFLLEKYFEDIKKGLRYKYKSLKVKRNIGI